MFKLIRQAQASILIKKIRNRGLLQEFLFKELGENKFQEIY
jgi:hypothetical protein